MDFALRKQGGKINEMNLTFSAVSCPISEAGHLHRYSADPRHHLPLWQMTAAHQSRPTVCCLIYGMGFQKNRKFGLNCLMDQILRAGS